MHNLSEDAFLQRAENFQPWLHHGESSLARQKIVQDVLRAKAGARFGNGCFVAEDACVFTSWLICGDRTWIASGAIIRGHVDISSDCTVNPYAHIAGRVSIGAGCRISSLASIYGFNHGMAEIDVFIKDQPHTSSGVKLHEDIWVGASAIIVDGVEIGPHSVIAAGAVVTKSFGAYQVIGGNPAKTIYDRRSKARQES